MKAEKFDHVDRSRVIRELEKRFSVRLQKVGKHDRWRRDKSGRDWWIIGGYGQWHGIPNVMMEAQLNSKLDGILVLAVRKLKSMEIFSGPVVKLVEEREKLLRARRTSGDYQFNCKVRGNHIFIEQIEGFSLERLTTLSYGEQDRAKEAQKEKAEKLLKGLSKEEKRQLIESSNKKGEH